MNLVTHKISIVKPKVNELINLIQNSVEKSIGNDYEVKLYGSHSTGLCLPWSDIDVVLCKKSGNISNDNSYNNKYIPLHDLFNYLQKNNDFKSINYIGATTVPLIKIKTKENTGIKNADISLQDNTHYGIKCVSLILGYKKEYEVLLPMVLALKNILKQANLNDPYTGGLSSYGLVLLVVHFLQMKKEKDEVINMDNVGKLFYEFLVYYSMQFNPKETIIDPSGVLKGENVDLFDRNFFVTQSDLIIIDPLNSSNNVGKNTREFEKIRLAFSIAVICMKEYCECGCHYESEYNNEYFSTDHCLLKRIFSSVKRHSSDNFY